MRRVGKKKAGWLLAVPLILYKYLYYSDVGSISGWSFRYSFLSSNPISIAIVSIDMFAPSNTGCV